MTAMARRIRAIPVRTASGAWAFVVDLIVSGNDEMRPYLKRAGNAGAMVIAEEHTQLSPMVLSGCGPQVRIYTLHGPTAIDGDCANEQGLVITATEDWILAIPATGADFDLVDAALAGIAHVTVYDPDKSKASTASATAPRARGRVTVDLNALRE